jgi:hypothetical protein
MYAVSAPAVPLTSCRAEPPSAVLIAASPLTISHFHAIDSPFRSRSCLIVSSFTSISFMMPCTASHTSSSLGITVAGASCARRRSSISPSTLISFTSSRAAMTRSVNAGRSTLLKQVASYCQLCRHPKAYQGVPVISAFAYITKQPNYMVSYAVFRFSRPSSSVTAGQRHSAHRLTLEWAHHDLSLELRLDFRFAE